MTKLTKYGMRELLLCALVLSGLTAFIFALAARVAGGLLALLAIPAALTWWVLWFFRDPHRSGPVEEGLFLSPADGRVTDITPIGADSALACEGVKIGIFMSVFDVHVNRCPEAGTVRRIEHRDGAFLDARHPDAAERNESATVWMTLQRDGREYPFVFRQIAGLIARRIVTDLCEGQTLCRGQRIGMIKFGSRMELLVPRELAGEVRVRIGDHVLAGRTVLIARRSEGAGGPPKAAVTSEAKEQP